MNADRLAEKPHCRYRAGVSLPLRIEGVASLAHGEARSFAFEREGETLGGFVMRHGDALVAYVNRCPHWGVDLDMGSGRFYAAKVDRIVCCNHGALFQPRSGVCDMGPCAGQGLEPLAVRCEGPDAVVSVRDGP